MRSQSRSDEKYRAYCQKLDYLRELDPDKRLAVNVRSEQLFNHCLKAGIGMGTPSTIGQYIPNEMVSSQLAQKVCYSLATAAVCDDYPPDQQDQNLLYRFLEELSNAGFNPTGEPISVIEELETSELKQKKNHLRALSETERWHQLHHLQASFFDNLGSQGFFEQENIISEDEGLAQYICQQIAGMRIFSDYPITTQDRYVAKYFHWLFAGTGPFKAVDLTVDDAIATLDQWIAT